MKKLILSTAIVLGALTAVTAQTEKERTARNQQVEHRLGTAQDAKASTLSTPVQDYKEVMTSEVPQTVKDAIAKDYIGSTISKAYVNAQGEYKVELATADAKKATVLVNKNGELSKNELKKQ